MEKTGKGIMKSGLSWIRTIRGIRYQIIEYCKELSDINICQSSCGVHMRVRIVHTKVDTVIVQELPIDSAWEIEGGISSWVISHVAFCLFYYWGWSYGDEGLQKLCVLWSCVYICTTSSFALDESYDYELYLDIQWFYWDYTIVGSDLVASRVMSSL